jgi:dephospho-CoA kinase
MRKKIIGLIGETGSGKDTFCNIAKEIDSSILFLRFSQPLSSALGLFFNEIKKEDQQWLANALRDKFGEDILMKGVAQKIERATEEVIVLNGARVKEEINFIRSLGGIIVYITASPEKRWKRIQKRGEKGDDDVSYEKFLKIDLGRTEAQIKDLGESADKIIDNSGTIEAFKKECEKLIKKLDD